MITLSDIYREKAALRTLREDAWNNLRMALLAPDALVPTREVRMGLIVKVEAYERTLEILNKQEVELIAAGRVTDPSSEMAAERLDGVTDSRAMPTDGNAETPPAGAARGPFSN